MAECVRAEATVVGAVALSSLPGSQHLRTLALTAYWRVQEEAGEERTDSEEAREDLKTPGGTLLKHLGHTDTRHYNTPCILTLNTTTPSITVEACTDGVVILQVPVSGVLVASPVPGDPCRVVVLGVAPYDTHPYTTPNQPGTTPTHPGTTPTNPGTKPTQPCTTPTQPCTTPTQPCTTPTHPAPPALVLALTVCSVLKLNHLLAFLDKLNPDLRRTRLTSVSAKPPPKPLRLSQRKLSNQLADKKTPPPGDGPPPLTPKRKHKPEGTFMGQEGAPVELQRHKEEETGMAKHELKGDQLEKHELKGRQHQKPESRRDQPEKHESKEDQHEKRVNDEIELLRQRGEEARAGRYGLLVRGQCEIEPATPVTDKVRMRGQDTTIEVKDHGQTLSPATISGHYPLRGTLSVSRAQDCPSGIYDHLGPPRSVGEDHGDGKNAT